MSQFYRKCYNAVVFDTPIAIPFSSHMFVRSAAIIGLSMLMPATVFAADVSPSVVVKTVDVPASQSVSVGAKDVKMMTLEFTASCDASVSIRGITFVHWMVS